VTEDALRLEVASLTDVGLCRDHNEDCLGNQIEHYGDLVATRGYLFAVADGMGGHALGEVASQLAIDTLFDVYYHMDDPDLPFALSTAIEITNATVHQQAATQGTNMGTTLTVALLHDSILVVANVGDSRIYRIRDGQALQLTRDHSLIAEHIRRGLLTEEQARYSHVRNVITRSIGHRPAVEIDISEMPIRPDDVILLCSDGLHGLIEGQDLVDTIEAYPLPVAAQAFIDLANSRGGIDNITCVLVRVLACPSPDQVSAEAAEPEAVAPVAGPAM
jgi:serine/threonine protein phosphatase PrpC